MSILYTFEDDLFPSLFNIDDPDEEYEEWDDLEDGDDDPLEEDEDWDDEE